MVLRAASSSSRVDPRIPFFARVAAQRLLRCRANNLSAGGIGLTAIVGQREQVGRGDEVELEVPLGDAHRRIRVVGRVAWTSGARSDGRMGLGVEFREMRSDDRATLAMFLANHRPRVVVARGSAGERELVRAALTHAQVDLVDEAEEVSHELLSGCGAILLFSHDPEETTAFLDAVWSERAQRDRFPGELPLAPIVLCTQIDAERLLPLFGDGRVQEVLRPPVDAETLARTVARSCERWAVQAELGWATVQLEGMSDSAAIRASMRRSDGDDDDPHIVRESSAMTRVYELIDTVAAHEVPVLLLGETGTGKELAARAIHARSRRAHTPFVAQDCGALTETLLESELFGHVRGAFTGAVTDNPGLFQIADGGTIFLDEIQNTSPGLQAKLLRVVEEGEVRSVGSAKPRRVNVRLIAACNVDLRDAVKERRFRADFFYRLNRFPIELPALRDHRDDVLPLTRYFIGVVCASMGRLPSQTDAQFERTLQSYDWPGNIRELRNAVERSILLTRPGGALSADTLPDDVRQGGGSEGHDLESRVRDFERRLIQEALERNEGVIRRAARDLEVNAVTLGRKMRRHGLD